MIEITRGPWAGHKGEEISRENGVVRIREGARTLLVNEKHLGPSELTLTDGSKPNSSLYCHYCGQRISDYRPTFGPFGEPACPECGGH
jgi:hypothetical protein